MPKPQNEDRKNTTVVVPKHLKQRFRRFANPSSVRGGYESDAEVLGRIVEYYEEKVGIGDRVPNPTYVTASSGA